MTDGWYLPSELWYLPSGGRAARGENAFMRFATSAPRELRSPPRAALPTPLKSYKSQTLKHIKTTNSINRSHQQAKELLNHKEYSDKQNNLASLKRADGYAPSKDSAPLLLDRCRYSSFWGYQ